jgi:hypothetical protein
MPYTPHQVFINKINGGYPIIDQDGYFVLNQSNEQMVGLDLDVVLEVGHVKSKKARVYLSKRQLIELRGILNSAIDDLYEGVEMGSLFDTDIK